MYDSSGGKAVFIVVCRGGDLLLCQRLDEFILPVLDSIYSGAEIATRSLYTITRRLSMPLWSSHLCKPRVLTPLRSLRKERSGVSTLDLRRCGLVDVSGGFRAFYSRLRLADSHDRPTEQSCVGPTQY